MTIATHPPRIQIDTVASLTSATKIYGAGETTVRALDDVTIGFSAESFTAIMGPSGSGKSTLLHCLAGLDRLTAGTVTIGGCDLDDLSDAALTRLRRDRIGFVFQAYNLVPTLTAGENIDLPALIARRDVTTAWRQRVVSALGLDDRLGHLPAELSGGQQQRVAVARAMLGHPEIILADEPSGNLDSGSGEQLLAFLRRAVDEYGQTIVMVTHDPRAAAHADRVVLLVDGRPVDEIERPTADLVLDRMKRLGA